MTRPNRSRWEAEADVAVVTLGMPTYNGARFLPATLESLLAQDFEDFELVISDNGSTDETEAICRTAAARDRRVRYERSPTNRGAAWNYNNVLSRSRSRYFKWVADDDLCEPTFLTRCVNELERSPSAVLAWPRTMIIDEHGDEVGELSDVDLDVRDQDPVARLSHLLRHRGEWHPVFGVMRTDVLTDTEGIGAFVSADIALLADLALRGEFHQIPETLFLRRYHAGRSLVANVGFEGHATWYDPSNANKRAVLPKARMVRELLRRTESAPLSTRDRLRASRVVFEDWAVPHWRHIGGEIKRALPSLVPHPQ